MEFVSALASYGFALGRWQAAWRFASPELRRAVSMAQIADAWDIFRRDAGAGAVGPAHEESVSATGIGFSADPRRDGVLLWLVDYGAASIGDAGGLVARMVGATRRFTVEDQELLQAARDALAGSARLGSIARLLPAPDGGSEDTLASLRSVAMAVDWLREDLSFAETPGTEVRHQLPTGALRHYVPAEPGAAWALNLALLASGTSLAESAPVPGLVSRALFRVDTDPEALVGTLIDGCTSALTTAYVRLGALHAELGRGDAALSHMSRNARARNAWLLVVALRATTRMHLARALGLSRAGADIQAHTLADVGLAHLGPAGRVAWRPQAPVEREAAPFDEGPLSDAAAELEESMMEIDRLLARTSR